MRWLCTNEVAAARSSAVELRCSCVLSLLVTWTWLTSGGLEDWLEPFAGQHAHHVRGEVPGEKGVLRAEQLDDKFRLLGAWSP